MLSIESLSNSLTNEVKGLHNPIQNTEEGTLPGDAILIRWREHHLMLPRTNSSGTPSYSDGRWFWMAKDIEHPEFKTRKKKIVSYRCEPT